MGGSTQRGPAWCGVEWSGGVGGRGQGSRGGGGGGAERGGGVAEGVWRLGARLGGEDEGGGGEGEPVEDLPRDARDEGADAGHAEEEADDAHLFGVNRSVGWCEEVCEGVCEAAREGVEVVGGGQERLGGRPARHDGEGRCEGGVGGGPGDGVEGAQAPGGEEAGERNLRSGEGERRGALGELLGERRGAGEARGGSGALGGRGRGQTHRPRLEVSRGGEEARRDRGDAGGQ